MVHQHKRTEDIHLHLSMSADSRIQWRDDGDERIEIEDEHF